MASKSASSGDSLVLPEALDDVFDIIDVNRDGVLTVQEFILVRYEREWSPFAFPYVGSSATFLVTPIMFASLMLCFFHLSNSSQALRKNPEVGRLLDLGTVVHQEEDSRDLFERVFQRLDADSSRTVTRTEFQEYFRPEPQMGANRGGTAGSAVSSAPTSQNLHLSPHHEKEEDWDAPAPGCCGGGGRRRRSRSRPQSAALPTPSRAATFHSSVPASTTAAPHALAQRQSNANQPLPNDMTLRADISPEELSALKDELERLRSEVTQEGEARRAGEVRLQDIEKENTQLRSEFNLQSLKQDMLVHMWSMHMLDADVEDEM